jgi:hypothetical protein
MEQFYTYLFEEHYRVAGRVLRRELKTGGSKWLSSILEERGTIPQKNRKPEKKSSPKISTRICQKFEPPPNYQGLAARYG